MSDIPQMPDFGSGEVPESSPAPKASASPVSIPAADVVETPPVSESAPKKDESQPTTKKSSLKASDLVRSLGALDDHVDETLHHVTELAVKVLAIDEGVSVLSATVEDTREEMHAGFAEIRAAQERPPTPAVDTSKEELNFRVRELEDQIARGTKQQGVRLGVVVALQVVLLAAVVWGLWGSSGSLTTSSASAVPPVSDSTAVADELSGMPSPEGDAQSAEPKRRGKKRRRKR